MGVQNGSAVCEGGVTNFNTGTCSGTCRATCEDSAAQSTEPGSRATCQDGEECQACCYREAVHNMDETIAACCAPDATGTCGGIAAWGRRWLLFWDEVSTTVSF